MVSRWVFFQRMAGLALLLSYTGSRCGPEASGFIKVREVVRWAPRCLLRGLFPSTWDSTHHQPGAGARAPPTCLGGFPAPAPGAGTGGLGGLLGGRHAAGPASPPGAGRSERGAALGVAPAARQAAAAFACAPLPGSGLAGRRRAAPRRLRWSRLYRRPRSSRRALAHTRSPLPAAPSRPTCRPAPAPSPTTRSSCGPCPGSSW